MCGIVGYTGNQEAAPIFLEGLKKLEYRGYDSSGIAYNQNNKINIIKSTGKVQELEKKINRYKNFGILDQEHVTDVGINAKMNEFQAAMGLLNLEQLPSNIENRKRVVLKYRELLQEVQGIKLNSIQENVQSNYAYFPILVEDSYGMTRDELYNLLKSFNIYARKYFYPISNDFKIYKDCKGQTPIAHDISQRILTLPLYSDLSLDSVERICNIIKNKKQKVLR